MKKYNIVFKNQAVLDAFKRHLKHAEGVSDYFTSGYGSDAVIIHVVASEKAADRCNKWLDAYYSKFGDNLPRDISIW